MVTLVVDGPVRKVVVSCCQAGADWAQVETSVVPVPLAPR
ncbi:cystathionine beta-lyase family protein involved in aluminum resistance [Streptomyces sp. SAI-129]